MRRSHRNRHTLAEMLRISSYMTSVEAGPGGEPHSHEAHLDEKGDGQTSKEAGHRHRVADGIVQPAGGHIHEILDYESRRQIHRRAAGNKPNSEPRKRKPESKPVGVGPASSGMAQVFPPGMLGGGNLPAQGESLELFEEYGFTGEPFARVGWRSPQDAFRKYAILRDVLQEGNTLLDVGCGTGMLYEWLIKQFRRKVDYFGIDHSPAFLKEFIERFPEVSGRVGQADALTIQEDLPGGPYFDVAVAFGTTSDFGEGDEKYARLHTLGSFMRGVSDVMIVEFWDRTKFKVEDGPGEAPSVWSPKSVERVFCNVPHEIVRPLTPGGQDFAVVSWQDDIV